MGTTVSAAALLFLAFPASLPQRDWFASVYTPGGVEVTVDERVFALYAVLNAMGYDDAPVVRRHPIPKRRLHPLRLGVRQTAAAAKLSASLEALDRFFDAHALPLDHYVAHALRPAPALAELDALVLRASDAWGLSSQWLEHQAAVRPELARQVDSLDGPLNRARELLGVPPRPVRVVVNVLGNDTTHGVSSEADARPHLLVVGPPDEGPQGYAERVVRAYAEVAGRGRLRELIAKARSSGRAMQGFEAARARGAVESTLEEYGSAVLARAIALHAVGADEAAYARAAAAGYINVRAVGSALETKGLERAAMEAF